MNSDLKAQLRELNITAAKVSAAPVRRSAACAPDNAWLSREPAARFLNERWRRLGSVVTGRVCSGAGGAVRGCGDRETRVRASA